MEPTAGGPLSFSLDGDRLGIEDDLDVRLDQGAPVLVDPRAPGCVGIDAEQRGAPEPLVALDE